MPKTLIVEATSDEQYREAAQLMREFLAWVRKRYRDSPGMIDTYFDDSTWEQDLASLNGEYGAPHGATLLAFHGGNLAGCVAMRKLERGTCEMKRLYVRREYQKCGIGRRLCERLLRCARDRGFHRMRLETGDQQHEAQELYRALGFREIDPYYQHPPILKSRVIFMEASLQRLSSEERVKNSQKPL